MLFNSMAVSHLLWYTTTSPGMLWFSAAGLDELTPLSNSSLGDVAGEQASPVVVVPLPSHLSHSLT